MVSLLSSVEAGSVLHAELDTAGRANVVVLNNVTGLCYEYGLIKVGVGYDYTFGDDPSEIECVSIVNSAGEIGGFPANFDTSGLNGVYGGIAFDRDYAISYAELSSALCTRSDFREGYAVINGVYYPISSGVQCFIKDTGSWVATVDEVRTASNSIRVYYDKAPELGGMVRIVVAE